MPFDPNMLLQGLDKRADLLEDWDDAASMPETGTTRYVAVSGIQPNMELQDVHIDLSKAFARQANPVTVDLRGGMNSRDHHDPKEHGPLPYQECLVKFGAPVPSDEALAAITAALVAQCERRDIMFDDYCLKMDANYRP